MKLELTTAALRNQCRPPAEGETNSRGNPLRQLVYWDTHADSPRGFGVVAGRRSKTFVVQRHVDGRSRRHAIGEFPAITLKEARRLAWAVVGDMGRGVVPERPKRRSEPVEEVAEERAEWRRFTLREAIEEHKAFMTAEGCAARSIEDTSYRLGMYLEDWLDRPLAEIRSKDCIDRHRRITEENGPTVANQAMRLLRAVWNTARARFEEMPPQPLRRAEGGRRFPWNKTRRVRNPITWADLPRYWAKVEGLGNPIRRDLRHFMLLTGLRSTDAKTVRWEHVNLTDEPASLVAPTGEVVTIPPGCIHRPQPKGGEDRAFTVPMSAHVLALLARRRLENRSNFGDDGGWVFPRHDAHGRPTFVSELKEQRYENGKKVTFLPSPHRLRDTFITAMHEIGISSLDQKVLVNHRIPEGNDVTSDYARPSIEHLREVVERVNEYLHERAQVMVKRASA